MQSKPIAASQHDGVSRKCLVPNCSRQAEKRGCCGACINVFYRGVRAKKMSWKKLINQGLVLPPRSMKRSPAAVAVEKIGK